MARLCKLVNDADDGAPCSLKPNFQLDFTDPGAVKQLTKTLLSVDYGLKIELPDDRLCPPVSSVKQSLLSPTTSLAVVY